MNSNVKRGGRDQLLLELKKLDAHRVILALDTYEMDPEKRAAVMEDLQDNPPFQASNCRLRVFSILFYRKAAIYLYVYIVHAGTKIRSVNCYGKNLSWKAA